MLVCGNNSSRTSSPFMVTDSLGKSFKRSKVPWWGDKLSAEITLNKWLKEQNSVKTCTKSPKMETTPFYGNRCNFDKKRKSCPYKKSMKRLKSYKNSNLLVWKFILWKFSSTAATRFLQLPTYSTAGEVSQQYLPTIRFQCSNFVEIE